MACDDCTNEPCTCEPCAKWITDTLNAGRGDVEFSLGVDGRVVLFWFDSQACRRWVTADTAEEAIAKARGLWTPPVVEPIAMTDEGIARLLDKVLAGEMTIAAAERQAVADRFRQIIARLRIERDGGPNVSGPDIVKHDKPGPLAL